MLFTSSSTICFENATWTHNGTHRDIQLSQTKQKTIYIISSNVLNAVLECIYALHIICLVWRGKQTYFFGSTMNTDAMSLYNCAFNIRNRKTSIFVYVLDETLSRRWFSTKAALILVHCINNIIVYIVFIQPPHLLCSSLGHNIYIKCKCVCAYIST